MERCGCAKGVCGFILLSFEFMQETENIAGEKNAFGRLTFAGEKEVSSEHTTPRIMPGSLGMSITEIGIERETRLRGGNY